MKEEESLEAMMLHRSHCTEEIYQNARNKFVDIVHRAKSIFYSAKIVACDTSKKSFSVTSILLG